MQFNILFLAVTERCGDCQKGNLVFCMHRVVTCHVLWHASAKPLSANRDLGNKGCDAQNNQQHMQIYRQLQGPSTCDKQEGVYLKFAGGYWQEFSLGDAQGMGHELPHKHRCLHP